MIIVNDGPTDARVRSFGGLKGQEILTWLLNNEWIQSTAARFRDSPETTIGGSSFAGSITNAVGGCPKSVYVTQREFATAIPSNADIIGTDEMTTCMGLVLRNEANGRTSVAHLDSWECVRNGIEAMVETLMVEESTNKSHMKAHLIGSFDDSDHFLDEVEAKSAALSAQSGCQADGKCQTVDKVDSDEILVRTNGETYKVKSKVGHVDRRKKRQNPGYSRPLATAVISHLNKSKLTFEIATFCMLALNTISNDRGHMAPIVRGFGVHLQTGDVFPAKFTPESREPDLVVRSICAMSTAHAAGPHSMLLSNYNTEKDLFVIQPCRYKNVASMAHRLLGLSDEEFLQEYSTSPFAETEEFLEMCREKLRYQIEVPDWRMAFPNNAPRVFARQSSGGWYRLS